MATQRRRYVRLVADTMVVVVVGRRFFPVTKNFGGRIREIHCFYGPCKSGDIVAVQK